MGEYIVGYIISFSNAVYFTDIIIVLELRIQWPSIS